jgi:hypothetical protein
MVHCLREDLGYPNFEGILFVEDGYWQRNNDSKAAKHCN